MRVLSTSRSSSNLLATAGVKPLLANRSTEGGRPFAEQSGQSQLRSTGVDFPLQATASAASEFSPSETSAAPGNLGASLRERLDFKPRLGILDKAICVLAPAAVCSILYLGVRPKVFKPVYAVGMAMIYAGWLAITRAFLLERQYSKRLVAVQDLGDADSQFPEIGGLKVHAKVFKPRRGGDIRAQMHCFHGFGANVESWEAVQQNLADKTSMLVSSHDKPGFGLTERPIDPKKYSSDFNAHLGRTIMDLEAQKLVGGSNEAEGTRLKRILIGHSMGAGSAAAEAIKNPEDVAAVILVAPAIMCFDFLMPQQGGRSGVTQPDGQSYTVQFPTQHVMPMPERKMRGNKLKRTFLATARAIFGRISRLVSLILAPVTIVGLRASVRSRAFWEKGLARAWYDKSKLTPKIIDAYRKPQLVRGWERGLVNFTSSRLGGSASVRQTIVDAWRGTVKPLQAEQLANVVNSHGIKVLIVHGKQDRVVPARNSQRLASLIPSARLVLWDETGHLPQEEHPENFTNLVESFAQSI